MSLPERQRPISSSDTFEERLAEVEGRRQRIFALLTDPRIMLAEHHDKLRSKLMAEGKRILKEEQDLRAALSPKVTEPTTAEQDSLF